MAASSRPRSPSSSSCRASSCRRPPRSEEHTSELQSRLHLVCRLLLEKKKKKHNRSACKTRDEISVFIALGILHSSYTRPTGAGYSSRCDPLAVDFPRLSCVRVIYFDR